MVAIDGPRGLQLVAHLSGARLSIVELKEFCAVKLPPYMIPERFVFHEALPRTSRGKIDFERLRRGPRRSDRGQPEAKTRADAIEDCTALGDRAELPGPRLGQAGGEAVSLIGEPTQCGTQRFGGHRGLRRCRQRHGQAELLAAPGERRLIAEERVRDHGNFVEDRFVGRVGAMVGYEEVGLPEHGPLIDVVDDPHVLPHELAAGSRRDIAPAETDEDARRRGPARAAEMARSAARAAVAKYRQTPVPNET